MISLGRLVFLCVWLISLRVGAISVEVPDAAKAAVAVSVLVKDVPEGKAIRLYVKSPQYGYVDLECAPVGPGTYAAVVSRQSFSGNVIELYVSSSSDANELLLGAPLQPIRLEVAPPGSQDLTPPLLEHTVPELVSTQFPLVIRARVKDPSGIFIAHLLWKHDLLASYVSIPLKREDGDTFRIDVPPEHLVRGFRYYLEAFDKEGNGPTRVGSADAPLIPVLTQEAPAWSRPPVAQQVPGAGFTWGVTLLAAAGVSLGGGLGTGYAWWQAEDFSRKYEAQLITTSLLITGAILAAGGGVLLAVSQPTP